MEISYSYLKKRSAFGAQPLFCEQGPQMCDSIVTNPVEFKNFILRNPVHKDIQHAPICSQHFINTIRAEYSNSGANHAEGGWPKDVNIHDPEATQRYRRKIEKEDGYIHCIQSQAPGLDHYIMQNNAIDLYRSYYVEMPSMPELEQKSVRTVNVYRDPKRRPATSISWQPEGHRFCVCYVDVDFYRVSQVPVDAYIWDMENANSPEIVLQPGKPMFDLKFCQRDTNLLAGGLETGQVVQFDMRAGCWPVAVCPPHVAHRDIARNVLFIQSKTGLEFFSSGPDGTCKWWDMRNLNDPTDEMIIDIVKSSFDEQKMSTACGVSALEYEPTIPTRFMVGTDNGLVVSGNRKGKTPMEKLPVKFDAHNGPVRSLQRNPAFPKNFLTVGDWTVRVWSEDCRESAVLFSPPLRHRVTCGTWSPTRLSLMLMCGADGCLTLWDILRSQHEPVLTIQLCFEPLLSIAYHELGSLIALGARDGNVYLAEASHSLSQSDKHDKAMLTAMFERESKRERILEARMREIRLKIRQAEEGTPRGSLTEADPTIGDRDLAEATAEYMQQVKKEIASM